ncbi:ZrgA family zinc uptake protein [Marinobacter sp. F3R11]|uniref:ZrgA family zinc uptake protein n=1 Tax=Marinobacter sp. F3R11 TaxID=2267231 RepID=UPI000DE8E82C|nr:DUF2796 domain-containing protein [Marinobacter sp. F3R11]RBW48965.1 DUF2796 domain-containing protein [Marinobacter sp. F3R11]
MFPKKLLASSIVSALLTATVSSHVIAADNPGAHQHGHADMQLAFSADEVEVLLQSAAGNLLGFEHLPRTPEDHQAIEKLTNWLEETPLINTPESTCIVKTTTVQHEVTGGHHDDHDHDEHEHHDHDDHDEHDHDEHEHDEHEHDEHEHDEHEHDHESQHTDITVTQTLSCQGLDKASALTTPLTTRFSGIEDLDVAWAGPDGQGASRLEHGESSFKLGL